MEFEVLVDCAFADLGNKTNLFPVDNKSIASIVNDYEEGSWRFNKFQNFVWDHLAETALSYKEREALQSQPASMLKIAAQNLRLTDKIDNIGKGSELAEIILYGIMKQKYQALPVVPKIFYKQNSNDNAKGADSVHIVINEDDFSIWFGEAKFYNSIENARLKDIVTSVKNSLATDKLKKENSIVTNLSELDSLISDEVFCESIKLSLSNKESIDTIKPRLNIPILLLHECDITASANELDTQYIKDLEAHHLDRATAYFAKQIEQLDDIHMYSKINFHLILFPIPNKRKIVDTFVDEANFYQGK